MLTYAKTQQLTEHSRSFQNLKTFLVAYRHKHAENLHTKLVQIVEIAKYRFFEIPKQVTCIAPMRHFPRKKH